MNAAQGSQYLLEIGVEELPADFLLSAPAELAERTKAALAEQGISCGDVKVYATPRRLALIAQGLPEHQPPRTVQVKGPPARVALDAQGQATQAGLGFARKVGVDFSALSRETVDGETYLVFNKTVDSRPTPEILAEIMPNLVLGLSGSHFMAWGDYEIRFSRPIRWLVSLWNEAHLPVQIGPVRSETISYGHRTLSDGPVQIASVEEYLSRLEEQGAVIADQERRKVRVRAMLEASAQSLGGVVPENEGLLDTVTLLVEAPSIVTGRFDERFLDIPEEVTTTVMAAHQKYFPVHFPDGRLMPCFMTVSNGAPEAADTIRRGNEKVLTARLEDARFFFAEDRKTPLESRLETLKGMTFQKGLGSLYDKTLRLEALASQVAEALSCADAEKRDVQRAARLAKTDLATAMVFELTELQGVMGRKYALLQGESEPVAEAIFEHYLPRFPGDAVARNPVGIAVGLADKIDTLTAVFSRKDAKPPSGSKDPLGLRRMASGVIQTILENRLRVDLRELIRHAYRLLTESMPSDPNFETLDETLSRVDNFVLQRFRGMLLERDNRYDIIDAVLDAEKPPLCDLQDVMERLEQLKVLSADEAALKNIYEPANRIGRILAANDNPLARPADIQATLFRDESENGLLEALIALDAAAPAEPTDYDRLMTALHQATPAVTLFFEKVMVNDQDDAVRKNRYNLLSALNRFYLRLARFSRLVVV